VIPVVPAEAPAPPAERPDDATAEIPVVEADEPVEGTDIAVDPVFEELVQAHGGDPVHDVLPDAPGSDSGPSSAPATGG